MNLPRILIPATIGVMAVAGVAGGTLMNSLRANAAIIGTGAPSTVQQPSGPGRHIGANGVKEELLTGDLASKAKSAAPAAVPGGTILRVETDAEGATYEAHMTKPDGTPVTVKMDANFKVTGTEAEPGARPSASVRLQ